MSQEESRLRDEIAAGRVAVASLSHVDLRFCSPERAAKAELIRRLSKKEERLELLLEKERVASVVKEYDEMHPNFITEDCPICLETIRVGDYRETFSRLMCCGNVICLKCLGRRGDGMRMRVCPLCRGKFPSDEEALRLFEMHANNGRAWAQFSMGLKHYSGKDGITADRTKALRLLKLAGDQGYSDALFYLGKKEEGVSMKSFALFKDAAELGHPLATSVMGEYYFNGWGVEKDYKKSAFFLTVAFNENRKETRHLVARMLGCQFFLGKGVQKSLYLAKHYLEISAEGGCHWAYHELAVVLGDLCRMQYEGNAVITGHSSVPKSLYCARKGLKAGCTGCDKIIKTYEGIQKGYCANCFVEARSFSRPLKQCGRCKAMWYCGAKCQLEHWKAGHRNDCLAKEKR